VNTREATQPALRRKTDTRTALAAEAAVVEDEAVVGVDAVVVEDAEVDVPPMLVEDTNLTNMRYRQTILRSLTREMKGRALLPPPWRIPRTDTILQVGSGVIEEEEDPLLVVEGAVEVEEKAAVAEEGVERTTATLARMRKRRAMRPKAEITSPRRSTLRMRIPS
jgi:hypothetical protein